MKKGTFGAAALENSDFQAIASEYPAASFSSISIGNGWYLMIMPAPGQAFINLTGITQFRLRFNSASNNNNIADYVTFYAGDAIASANRPVLTIKYNLP